MCHTGLRFGLQPGHTMAEIPKTIGRYEILERVGRGGMGVLYRAHDPALERDVALKMMHLDFTVDKHARERFQREARAVARLQHPNIVTIHELGEFDGTPFIVMEFLGGRDLEQMLRAGESLTLVQKLEIAEQICEALAYAHDHGIVHRDVKPANVRVLNDGKVKILDFGIARFATSSLTQSGAIMGTPSYMAPEQIMGQPVDGRADLFAAGVLLYELLSGRKPFTGESPTAVAYSIMHAEPPPLREELEDLPDAINTIVERALKKEPDDRYRTAREMASDLRTVRTMLDLPLSVTQRTVSATAPTIISPADLYATSPRGAGVEPPDAATDVPIRASAAEAMADAAPSSRLAAGRTSPFVFVAGTVVLVGIAAVVVALLMRGGGEAPAPGEDVTGTSETGAAGPGDTTAGGPGVIEPPAPRIFHVTSTPEGAAIALDGVPTGRVTPADLELTDPLPGRIELSLELYEPLAADLTDADVDAGTKAFTLTPAERPVRLTVSGSYPFELVSGGRIISEAATSHEVTIEPGTAVTARSAAYLLNARLSVNFRRSRQTTTLDDPGSLRVFAANETCTVVADGRDLSYPPIPPRPVAAGSHTIVLRCPDGTESRQTVRVRSGELATVTFGGDPSRGGLR